MRVRELLEVWEEEVVSRGAVRGAKDDGRTLDGVSGEVQESESEVSISDACII